MTSNYESKYWALIYDQMVEEDLADWLEVTRRFYLDNLSAITGPILECACGTGLILLPLLERGLNVYGFDSSEAMLGALRHKLTALTATVDPAARISNQQMESFSYDILFDAIAIPGNSFSMLTTRDRQRAALTRMKSHLAPGGRLMLDLHHWNEDKIAAGSQGETGRWHEWMHPAGGIIRQRIVSAPHDFERRIFRDRCFFEYGDDAEDFPMESCWIMADEFRELLASAGFSRCHVDQRKDVDCWSAEI